MDGRELRESKCSQPVLGLYRWKIYEYFFKDIHFLNFPEKNNFS